MSWQLAPSLQKLLAEVNAAYPGRSKVTDGTISGYTYGPGGAVVNPGNLSSHNINAQGYVCALDITTGPYGGGITDQQGYALAGKIRIALRDQPRGIPAYVIHWMVPPYVPTPGPYIATANTNWAWEPYGGIDPHTSHIHVSVDWDIPAGGNQSGQADYLTTLSWNIGNPSQTKPVIPAKPTTNGGLTVTDINTINAKLDQLIAATAPINTTGNKKVSLRQFIADGTRAAQAAVKQTAPINRGGELIPLIQEVADIKTKLYGIEPTIATLSENTSPEALAEALVSSIPDDIAKQVIEKLSSRLDQASK